MDKETHKKATNALYVFLIISLIPTIAMFFFGFCIIPSGILPSGFREILCLLPVILFFFCLVLLQIIGLFKPKPVIRSPDKSVYYPGDPCPKCGSQMIIVSNGQAECMDCGNKRKVRKEDQQKYDIPCPRCHSRTKAFIFDGYACADCGTGFKKDFNIH